MINHGISVSVGRKDCTVTVRTDASALHNMACAAIYYTENLIAELERNDKPEQSRSLAALREQLADHKAIRAEMDRKLSG